MSSSEPIPESNAAVPTPDDHALTAETEPVMLDVHPPHAAAHSWRDILIHLATITIGLFIALSLEAGVESLHHRHIVREARENIRREIEQNKSQAKENTDYVQADEDRMKHNLEKARALRSNSHALEHDDMHFTFTWSSFDEAAWHSARDSGALTYMPTAEVQTYADSYAQQEIVNREAIEIFSYQTDLAALLLMERSPSEMRSSDVQSLMQGCSLAAVRLTVLKQLIEGLDKNYANALKKPV